MENKNNIEEREKWENSMQLSNLFLQILSEHVPQAVAVMGGNADDPAIEGLVSFYATPFAGVLVNAELSGLPIPEKNMTSAFFAMHIHEFGDCTLPFDRTGMHYNPTHAAHPDHAGDMPPLLASRGYAWCAFYDERLTIGELIGKSIIVHRNRDDFTTQPSGDSGEKIACGIITRTRR